MITRTRRGVSRTVTTTAPVAPVEVVVSAPQPVSTPETAPPKVVTRTRGGARRAPVTPAPEPAGGPSEESVEGAEPTGDTAAETELHVPVKRKGAPRKR